VPVQHGLPHAAGHNTAKRYFCTPPAGDLKTQCDLRADIQLGVQLSPQTLHLGLTKRGITNCVVSNTGSAMKEISVASDTGIDAYFDTVPGRRA